MVDYYNKNNIYAVIYLQGLSVKPIEALACVLEAESFLKNILISEPAQGVSDGSGRKVGLINNLLLR